jgi:TonB family protein
MKQTSRASLSVRLGLITLMLPLLASGGPAAGEAQWHRINLEEEELSILVPVAPTVIVQTGDYLSYEGSDEKILEERKYSAYSDGFIYAIESYKVTEPQKLLKDMLANVSSYLSSGRDIKLDGYPGKQYESGGEFHQGQIYYLAASEHVYVVTLAALDKADPSLERFFSSMRLGGKRSASAAKVRPAAARGSGPATAPQTAGAQAAEQEKTYSPKDVTRKARIIWRPQPIYTEEARANSVTGTVVLRAVFSSSGQVTNIRTVSGLGDGLTEKAIEAARSIRFFPAAKDGKLVSQYIQIEYNFNLF